MDQERLERTRCKLHLKPWAQEVQQATGLALKMPDSLIDSMPSKWDKYVEEILTVDFRLQRAPGGYWERR